jgi:hypothetical protein
MDVSDNATAWFFCFIRAQIDPEVILAVILSEWTKADLYQQLHW